MKYKVGKAYGHRNGICIYRGVGVHEKVDGEVDILEFKDGIIYSPVHRTRLVPVVFHEQTNMMVDPYNDGQEKARDILRRKPKELDQEVQLAEEVT